MPPVGGMLDVPWEPRANGAVLGERKMSQPTDPRDLAILRLEQLIAMFRPDLNVYSEIKEIVDLLLLQAKPR